MTERIARHPNLTAWVILAVGMLAVLAWSARGMDLQPSQWAALGTATVLLAGACAWIISWEADEGGDSADEGGDRSETDDGGDAHASGDPLDAARRDLSDDHAVGATEAGAIEARTEPE